ncbi:hypothetical protein N5K32_002416 [Vibrio parahaemolyticus]|nr:hypothetical protein [Vibrio parahaemolyticus]EJG2010752.1 hypothetical protein [Vibrio parahaemolyticus]EJU8966626.1 hypothetical protein [Vibrio parahaemolyticus]HCD1294538.1 hypothetical protein [Vibrio parahaemolyticus]
MALDILANINVLGYFIALFFCVLISGFVFNFISKGYFLSPLLLVDLVYFQSALFLVFYNNSNYIFEGLFLVAFYVAVRCFFSLNIFRVKVSSLEVSQLFIKSVLFLNISVFLCVFYLLNFSGMATIGSAYKISWTLDYPKLSLLYSACVPLFFSTVVYAVKVRRNSFLISSFGMLLFVFNGISFHSKGFFLQLCFFVSLILIITDRKISLKNVFFIGFIVFGAVLLFYGGDVLGFGLRVLKNADGIFITLHESMNEKITLEYPIIVYIFKFLFFKLDSSLLDVGNLLALNTSYYYPQYGGPNSHILLYFILGKSKFDAIIMMLALVSMVTVVCLSMKKLSNNYFAFCISSYVYFNAFLLIQSPSTFFLLFMKYLVVMFFFVSLYLLMPKKKRFL